MPLTDFNSDEQDHLHCARALLSPGQLRLHPALVRLKLIESAIELNEAIQLQGRSVRERILITTNGTIIGGVQSLA